MRRNFIILVTVVLSTVYIIGCGQKKGGGTVSINNGTTVVEATITPYAIRGLVHPESIVIRNGGIYVANIGGDFLTSVGKGFITEYKNNTTKQLFVGLLDDPKGFAFLDDDTIIVSDHPSVKIIKISTGTVIATLPITSPGFLNDLVLINNSTALVSDTGTGLVHKISISTDMTRLSYVTITGINENGINGLAFDNTTSTLYFVTSIFSGDATRGHIYQSTLNADHTVASELTKWNSEKLGAGGLDGLVLVNGKLIISDWGISSTDMVSNWGKNSAENASLIYIFNTKDRSLDLTITGMITSIADMTVDDGIIYLPEIFKNQITSIDLRKYL